MSIHILPDFKIFHSIIVREVGYDGVENCREAYNRAIDIKTMYSGTILLPTLIEDKLKKSINNNQKEHFYAPLTRDFSTSGKAGFKYDTCLVETAIANSYERNTLILSMDSPVHNQEKIKDNKKIVVMTPHKFLSCCKMVDEYILKYEPNSNFMDILHFFMFIRPQIFDGVYSKNTKNK